MTRLKFILPSILFLLLISSCKENSSEITAPNTEGKNLIFKYSYENFSNTLVGEDYNNVLEWRQEETDSKGNSINKVIGNIILGFESLPEIKVLNVQESSVSLQVGKDVLSFTNILGKKNTLSFEVLGKNRAIEFQISDLKSDFSNFLADIPEGQVITNAKPIGWAIVFAAACIVVTVVDYYCDNQVAEGVAACTGSGKCSVVQTCGAECIECPKP